MQLTRRRPGPVNGTADDWGLWFKNQREILESKYGAPKVDKRATGFNLITNQNADSSFFGSVAIGTPPVSYDVILDTGSADLWVADKQCSTGCQGVPTFDSTQSSTFTNQTTIFSIQYGSGAAQGTLGQDVVEMAGFSVPNQVFGVCSDVSTGLLSNPVSGLLGLAWKAIATSGATPFWQTLAAGGAWDQPVMAFQLTRFINQTNANALEPGGTFTMGSVNTSLFTGAIDYIDVPSDAVTFWTLPVTSLMAQGNSVAVGTGSASYAAIDTGTTLVGGPASIIANLYAQIPGSAAASGNYQGYYTYPCSAAINISLSFGGRSWSVSQADFELAQIGAGQCLGAFFDLTSNSPAWIIGDTFLKNVYSVFRYSPPSVGFATLSETALAMNSLGGSIPSPTISSVASVQATGGTDRISNRAERTTTAAMSSLLGCIFVGILGLL